MAAVRQSMAFPDLTDLTRLGGEVRIDASFFASPSQAQKPTAENQVPSQHFPSHGTPSEAPPPTKPPPPTAPKPKQKSGGVDFSSYQFPVEDEDTHPTESGADAASSSTTHQQMSSAFKKEGVARKKTPAFKEK